MEERTTSSTGGQKGVKLERFDLIPVGPLTKLAEHFGRGARKYASHQWRQGYEWSKSYSATQRHLTAFWAGYDYDVCSNEPHNSCALKTDDGRVIEYSLVDATFISMDDVLVHIRVGDQTYKPEYAYEHDTCYNHTGSHHMTAVAWHSFALLEFTEEHPEHDDRHHYPDPKGTT